MDDEILTDLMNFAFKHDIGFTATDRLSPVTPSAVDTETRRIVLNLNWHIKRQIPYQFAHEIGHIINGDHANGPLYFTPGKNRIEFEANRSAVKLIMPYYLYDRRADQINPLEFMHAFAIPSHLESMVESELRKACPIDVISE